MCEQGLTYFKKLQFLIGASLMAGFATSTVYTPWKTHEYTNYNIAAFLFINILDFLPTSLPNPVPEPGY